MSRIEPILRLLAMRPWVALGLASLLLALTEGEPARAQIPHFAPAKADLVIVHKAARKLQLMAAGRVIASYRIALGRAPDGPKRREGDGRTPEGVYTVDWRNANSNFHRSLHVSYPRAWDDQRAERWGVSPGGEIMLHGLPNGVSAERIGHPYVDWTNGCIALTNEEIDEVWARVDDGTTIIIYP
jgi:murein L,D-transpeptidase YafK